MRTRIAATMICLSMAGCFKAGRKAPAVENRPNASLVESYNNDLGRKLGVYQQELFQLIEAASAVKTELREYGVFEKRYTESLEAKCNGIHSNSLENLHGEVVEWRSRVMGRMDELSSGILELGISLEREKLSMDTMEKEVGTEVISERNRGLIVTMIGLARKLREGISEMVVSPEPDSQCRADLASKGSGGKESPAIKDQEDEGYPYDPKSLEPEDGPGDPKGPYKPDSL